MANLLSQTIEQISREKGIDPTLIHEALEDAMVAAARKFFRTEENLQARYISETGVIEVFAVKEILEDVEDPELEMSLAEALEIDETFEVGDYIEIPKPTLELGRIAAQTAKQVIFQKVREAEREIVFEEFSGEIGQVVNGIVRRSEGGDIILDIGRTEAVLPYGEQSRNEQYKQGDRVRTVIIQVHRLSKGPQIVVSRSDPSLLIRLFETEIPEVYDGTVVIKNAVREGGERAKVAVSSNDDAVDPVGACVGMRGSRINAVIRELKGEKIDIIQYSDDINDYTINALNPARIAKVLIKDATTRVLEVIVPEDQLSLAIGKKGQNVRLASRLLGWEIDIKSEVDKKQEIIEQMAELASLPREHALEELTGLGEKTREKLVKAGIDSINTLSSMSVEDLTAIPGVGVKTAENLAGLAKGFLAEGVEETTEDAEEIEGGETEVLGEVAPAEEDSSEGSLDTVVETEDEVVEAPDPEEKGVEA
jgi:N utilization substance protein A